jgi:DNA-binding winged helix-turn-helix (wHTH) protein
MLRRLVERDETRHHHISEEEIRRLLQATGGHAGLIKAAYVATRHGELALDSHLLSILNEDVRIKDECDKIWDSLESPERSALQSVARGRPPDETVLRPLQRKGLIQENLDGTPTIFSPVFAAFISEMVAESPLLTVDEISHAIKIDGRAVDSLSMPEFEIFYLLYSKRPEACSQAELITRLLDAELRQREYRDSPERQGRPERRLAKCISEIKRKIEKPGEELIIAVANGGYRLISTTGR